MIVARLPAALLAGLLLVARPEAQNRPAGAAVEILEAVGGLPAHLAGRFTDPVAFATTTSGEYIVLDRRKHTVYGIDRAQTRIRTIIEVGVESGKLLQPAALSLAANDFFAVADAPGGLERIQYFTLKGQWVGGFHLPTRVAPRLVMGSLVMNGVGSLQYTGETFLLNRPEQGALIDELDTQGAVIRRVGVLRPTGQEADRDVHIALNVGIPLRDPQGGYFVVFRTGRPMFRKYDAAGELVYERHIEGPELDADIRALPTAWPQRSDVTHLPVVTPLVRTAAVDPEGRLWISLIEPYTYVYDRRGDKIRTVQFRGARLLAASSLFFAGSDRLLVTPGCYEFSIR
jgi:hypothetical protein